MVQSEDRLLWILHPLRFQSVELNHDGSRVVMGHHMTRPNGDKVATLNQRAIGKVYSKALNDFFNQVLGHFL